jgi:hypothetical protein
VQRKHFLVLAGVLALCFGATMIFSPATLLDNISTLTDPGSPHVLRWLGSGLLAVGVMNLLARNDPGSDALRGVMIGNVVLHLVALVLDIADYSAGIVKASGVGMGAIVHIGLAAGFLIFLRSTRASATL